MLPSGWMRALALCLWHWASLAFRVASGHGLSFRKLMQALAFVMLPTGAFAQAACTVADMQSLGTVFSEDFGTGPGRTADPNVLNHNFRASGGIQDNDYAVGRSIDLGAGYMRTAGDVDADGNTEGRYLGINMRGRFEPGQFWQGEFYRVNNITLTPGVIPPGSTLAGFQLSASLAGTCAGCRDVPNFTLIVEDATTNAQLGSRSSTVVGVQNDDIWRTTTVEVVPAPTGTNNVNLVLFNSQPNGSSGNDVGVDNIVFSSLICVPPELDLTKSSQLITNVVGDAGTAEAGDIIRYTYTVDNNGTTTAYNVAISETTFTGTGTTPAPTVQSGGNDLDGGNGTPTDLQPGASMVYTADYVLTQADINTGFVDNQATITYEDLIPNSYSTVSDSDVGTPGEQVERTTIPDTAALNVGKGAVVGPLQTDGTFDVSYTITIENTGNLTLTPLTLVDDLTAGDQLGTAFQSVVSAPVVSLTNTSGTSTAPTSAGGGYNGTNALLSGTDGLLQPGDIVTVVFSVNVNADAASAPATLQNTARATGTPPSGPTVGDDSDADTQPDGSADTTPNDPNDPIGSGVPTVIQPPTAPQVLFPITPQPVSVCTPVSTLYSELFDDGSVSGYTSTQAGSGPRGLLDPTNLLGNVDGTQADATRHPSLNNGFGVASPSGGGFISGFDNNGGNPRWTSPAIGGADWSAALNGAFKLEHFNWALNATAGNYNEGTPDIEIIGAAGTLQYQKPIALDSAALASAQWVTIEARLAPAPEWEFVPPAGATRAATLSDFVSVLGDVQNVRVGPENITGFDYPGSSFSPTADLAERFAIDGIQIVQCDVPGSLNAGKGVVVGPLQVGFVFDATYTITVENSGTVPLSPLSLVDDLTAADNLGTAFNGVVTAPVVTLNNVSGSSVAPSTNGGAYDGTNGLITGTDGTLQPGDSYTVVFTVNVDPNAAGRPVGLQNTALAGGTPPSGPDVFDETDTDTQPDGSPDTTPNDPDDPPGSGVPTLLAPPAPSPSMSIGKGASLGPVDPDGTFEVTYTITYLNTGTGPDDLGPVTLVDNLADAGQLGSAFNGVTSAPVVSLTNTSGGSTAPTTNGAAYDGTNGLITGTDGLIRPGDSFTVVFTVDVDPNAVGAPATLQNTARGTGIPPAGPPAVGDDSDTDTNPDGSPENIPNEADDAPGEGVPTVITNPVNESINVGKGASVGPLQANGLVEVTYTVTMQNSGNVTLSPLTLVDNLADGGQLGTAFDSVASAPVVTLTNTSGTSTAPTTNGAGYNGTNGLITGADGSLAPGDVVTVVFSVNVDSAAAGAPATLQNTAVGGGTPPSGTPITDDSDADTQPDGSPDTTPNDPNDPPGGGVPTLITPAGVAPAINVGKGAVVGPILNDGTFDITYTITIENTGNVTLSPLTLVDDLTDGAQLGTAFQSVTAPPVVTLTNTSGNSTAPTSNGGAYTGSNALLTGADGDLAPGDIATVVFTVNADANAAGAPATLQNTARATGTPPTGAPVGDDSDTDTQVDGTPDGTPNDPNDPVGGGVPTVITAPLVNGEIGATKSVLAVGAVQGDGSYDATYEIEVTNTGNVILDNLTLVDDLTSVAQLGSAFRRVAVAPAVTAGTINAGSTLPTANAGYDGTNGLINTSGTLNPGDSYIVTFTVNVNPVFPGAPVNLRNMATAGGDDPTGTTQTDDSDAGTNAAGGPDTVPDVPGGPGVPTLLPAPSAQSGVTIVKQVTGNRTDFRLGEVVPYTIVASNNSSGPVTNISVVDTMPVGLTYIPNSSTVQGAPFAPSSVISGRQISFDNLSILPGDTLTITVSARVAANAPVGPLTNQAGVYDNTGALLSNLAEATIQRIPDEIFDCTDIIGKVFDDLNSNGYQDGPQYSGSGENRVLVHAGEPGLAGVRVATARGTLITTDEYGRFHVPCAELPNGSIGGNIILKVDTRTLPSGYRMTSENPRVLRVTAGKLAKINFGASISRIVDIDLTGTAFEPRSSELKQRLEKGLTRLLQQMQDQPSVIRIAYYHKGEPRDLRQARVRAVEDYIQKRWKRIGRYKLDVEVTVTPVQ